MREASRRWWTWASVGRSPEAFGRSRYYLTNIGFETLNNSKGNAAQQVCSVLPFPCGKSLKSEKSEKSNLVSPEIPSFLWFLSGGGGGGVVKCYVFLVIYKKLLLEKMGMYTYTCCWITILSCVFSE